MTAVMFTLIWLVVAVAVGMAIGAVIAYRDRELPGEDEATTKKEPA